MKKNPFPMDIFIHLRRHHFSRRQAAASLALLSFCASRQSWQGKRPCGTAFRAGRRGCLLSQPPEHFQNENTPNHQYAGPKPSAPRSGVSLPASPVDARRPFLLATGIQKSTAKPRLLADDLFSLSPDMFGYELKHQ